MNTELTPTQIKALTTDDLKAMGYHHHHTASARGYLSRKGGAVIGQYVGKFGAGYTISFPRWDTTQYITVQYWIK